LLADGSELPFRLLRAIVRARVNLVTFEGGHVVLEPIPKYGDLLCYGVGVVVIVEATCKYRGRYRVRPTGIARADKLDNLDGDDNLVGDRPRPPPG
jgi:hypothetical protein